MSGCVSAFEWLKYCQYGVNINQSINQSINSLQEVDSLISEADQEERTNSFAKSLGCFTCCFKRRAPLAKVSNICILGFLMPFSDLWNQLFSKFKKKRKKKKKESSKKKDQLKWWLNQITCISVNAEFKAEDYS